MRYKKNGGVVPCSGKTQCSSRTGKWEGMGGRTEGGKGAYLTFGEWRTRKGEIIWNVNKKYIE